MSETPFGHLIEQILCEPDVSILSKFYNRKVEREQIKSMEEHEKKQKQWIRRQMLDECHERKPIPPMTRLKDRKSVKRPVEPSEQSKEELRLKLVATRGVVTLFNAIATHQKDLGSRLNHLIKAQKRADGTLRDSDDDSVQLSESRKKEAFRAEHDSKRRLIRSLRNTDQTRGYDQAISDALSTQPNRNDRKRKLSESVRSDDADQSGFKQSTKKQRRKIKSEENDEEDEQHEWGPLEGGFIENLIDTALDDRRDAMDGDDDSSNSDDNVDGGEHELFRIDERLSDLKQGFSQPVLGDSEFESEGSDRSAESLAAEMGIELSSGEDESD